MRLGCLSIWPALRTAREVRWHCLTWKGYLGLSRRGVRPMAEVPPW